MSHQASSPSPARQMEPIRLDNLLINFTTDFQRVWDTRTLRTSQATFWRPAPAPDDLPGYFPLGDIAVNGYANINGERIIAVVCEAPAADGAPPKINALSRPEDFERVWNDAGSGAKTHVSIWRPLPPAGYVALGLVCSNDHEKPSLNAVRCVRADLVAPAQIGDMIWSDKGSHAKKSVSVWATAAASTAAGEIRFSPGTFAGVDSHTRPDSTPTTYALRAPIACQSTVPLPLPELKAHETPAPSETASVTQVARLPWFAVKDSAHAALSQFRISPYYDLERTDRYVLVGFARNTDDKGKLVKWKAPRLPMPENLAAFTHATSIEMDTEWATGLPGLLHPGVSNPSTTSFCARLDNVFTHTQNTENAWVSAPDTQVVTIVASHKSAAVYQMQSTYRLLRADGTQAGSSIELTDIDSLHLTEYPPQDLPSLAPPEPPAIPEKTAEIVLPVDQGAGAIETETITVATDSAP